jgi:hypothetical protein
MTRLWIGILLVACLFAPGAVQVQAGYTPAPASVAAALPAQQALACSSICDKSGVNTAAGVRAPLGDYLRTQRLGMGWIMEIAFHPADVARTVEAINRAHDRNLQVAIRICAGDTCAFSNPDVYAQFLRSVASQIDGDFWAVMGPNEPELELWAGDATGVAQYMNAMIDRVGNIPNLKMLSPIFNLSDGITHTYFTTMEAAGARFGELDGFSGTAYNVAGQSAYYWYAWNTGHAEVFRNKVLRYGKPFLFAEYGTFATMSYPTEGDPNRQPIMDALRQDFAWAAGDPTVMGVTWFNAYGTNTSMWYHTLYDSELVYMTGNVACNGGGTRLAGVGIVTQQTAWQLNGEPTCRDIVSGCPFLQGTACQSGTCFDNDADGLMGDGGTCARQDCNDQNAAIGLTCGSAVPEPVEWGNLWTVERNTLGTNGWAWPLIEIGNNGLPLLAFYDGSRNERDLVLMDCTSPNCSTANRRTLVHANDAGNFPSMALRQNGNPVLSHLNETDRFLEFYDCSDPRCVSGVNRVLDQATGYWGFDTSIVVRPDGRPIIAYWHSDFQDLRLYDCADSACSSGTIRDLDVEGQTGYAPSIIIGKDGFPMIGYGNRDTQSARLFDCENASCTAASLSTLAISAYTLPTFSMASQPDGNPVIVLANTTTNALTLLRCTVPDCSVTSASTLHVSGGSLMSASIAYLPDGNPFIVYSETMPPGQVDMGMIACQDLSCSSSVTQSYLTGDAGEHADVAVRPDGNPLIVFHDYTRASLMAYDVDMSFVHGGLRATSTPTATAAATATSTSTSTPTATATATATSTSTSTPTATATATATSTSTSTPTATATATATSTSTSTPTATATPTDTPTATATATTTATDTPVPDTTPPDVIVDLPVDGVYTRCDASLVNFSASDTSGIASLTATLDGSPVTTGTTLDLLTWWLGDHSLTVTAVDGTGLTAVQSTTLHLQATIAGTQCAVDAFCAAGEIDNAGVCNSLTAKLTNAQSSLDKDNLTPAVNLLNAFLNEVAAQTEKHISTLAGGILSGDVQAILTGLTP